MPKPTPTHCKDCNIELDENTSSYGKDYKRNQCRDCYNRYFRERYKNNPKYQRDATRKSRFGLTGQQYDEIVLLQQGGCAICRQPCLSGENLSVDHDHKTGEIRGLLCGNCNRAIGLLKEDENIIWNMMEYLKRTKWNKKDAA